MTTAIIYLSFSPSSALLPLEYIEKLLLAINHIVTPSFHLLFREQYKRLVILQWELSIHFISIYKSLNIELGIVWVYDSKTLHNVLFSSYLFPINNIYYYAHAFILVSLVVASRQNSFLLPHWFHITAALTKFNFSLSLNHPVSMV